MSRQTAKNDTRLIGTWKSDRRRTVQHFQPEFGTSPEKLLQLKAMFGKLVVRWERGKYEVKLNGQSNSGTYAVVASDASGVVVRFHDSTLIDGSSLQHVHFDGNYYWIAASSSLIEWFRRVE